MNIKLRLEKPRWWIAAAAVLALIIYAASLSWRNFDGSILDWRWELLVVTGVFTWILLTLCMAIAARWRWMGRLTGGLDKGYGIHKWAGVAAAVVILLHWCSVQSWRWMLDWGWLNPDGLLPDLVGRLGLGGAFPLDALSRLGGGGGFFLLMATVVVALITRIPYHIFRAVHKIAPVVYLLAAVHMLNRIPGEWWFTPAAYLLLALTVPGVWAAVLSLRQAIARTRLVEATVVSATQQGDDIIDLTIAPKKPFSHRAGQFAFVDFTRDHHGSHPLSMASFNQERVRFLIKELGDMTGRLDDLLDPGKTVLLEGPYGRFDFDSPKPVQAWIAGGIGITPFVSRLEQLAAEGGERKVIHLWYSVDTHKEADFPSGIADLCDKAGVRLHTVVSEDDERLEPDDVAEVIGDLSRCSVWFCGPDQFGASMENGLIKKGLDSREFRSERFDLR